MANGWLLAVVVVVVVAVAAAGVVELVARRTLWGLVRGAGAGPASRDPSVARRSGAHLLLTSAYGAALLLVVTVTGTLSAVALLLVLAVYAVGVGLLRRALPLPPEYRHDRQPTQRPAHPPREPGAVFRRPDGT